MLEALINLFLCCCTVSIIGCIMVGLCARHRNRTSQIRSNLKIKDLLLKAASLKLNPAELTADIECSIWYVPFEKEHNVINLPWSSKHIFHADCIGEWVKRNNTCPLCKTLITAKDIEEAQRDDMSIFSNSSAGGREMFYQSKNEDNV